MEPKDELEMNKQVNNEFDDSRNIKGKGIVKELFSFAKEILFTVVVVFFVISFIVQPTTVDGSSMNPTLQDTDQLLIEKVSQRFGGIDRYDIIVFPYSKEENKYFIKRVIGLPGEEVNIIDGQVMIDGEFLEETVDVDMIMDYGSNLLPIIVPEGEYFVLGDNRNHSRDSRYSDVGYIEGDDILGKGFVRLWPFSEFGFLQ